MKKLSLILILVPIFLITSLNFYGGETDNNHNEESRALTCTACHATTIGGVLIGGGKIDFENDYTEIDINIPVGVEYTGVSVNVSGEGIPVVGDISPYISDDFGNLFNIDISSNTKGKKANTIKINYPITDLDRENGIIEIQGVLSNLDGKPEGEFSFYKKIEIQQIQKEISVYPTITNETVNIENIPSKALIQIYNTNGQIVYSQNVQNNSESINVSEFLKGNYFVLVQNGKEVSQSKFIVGK